MKYNATINLSGRTIDDLLVAIKEVERKIENNFESGSDSNDTGDYEFSVTKESNPSEDRPAPYETYLYVYDCKTGEEFFKELKDDDILDLESQVINWVKEHFCGELEVDLPFCDFEGDFQASIKTDFNSPDSVVVWESKGFYIK